jgi:hypothetical protein
MRLLTHFLCLAMLLACFAQPGLSFVDLDSGSQSQTSQLHAADSAPAPCSDSVRAGQLQRIWFDQFKARQAVVCKLAVADGKLATVQLVGMATGPRPSIATLLTQHVRLQL